MRVVVELKPDIDDDEIIIRQKDITKNSAIIKKIMSIVNDEKNSTMSVFKQDVEYFVDIKDILFFETDENCLQVHTCDNMFTCKYKLYELDNVLPSNFVRISKSSVLNIDYVESIERNLTSASLVSLRGTYKKVYVSRSYYKAFKDKITERRIIV